jgi:hypothetical protein
MPIHLLAVDPSFLTTSPQGAEPVTAQLSAVADAAPNQKEPKGLAVITPVSGQTAREGVRSTSSSGTFTWARTCGAAVISAILPSAK